jgi:hypothetical protein
VIINTIFLQDRVSEDVHSFGKIFEEDETQDIIAEFVSVHFTSKGVCYIPELLFKLLFVVFRHDEIVMRNAG